MAEGTESAGLAALAEVAFKKEKTAARRLAVHTGMSDADALQQVLSAAALPGYLVDLVARRQQIILQQVIRDHRRKQQQADARQRKQAVGALKAGQWQAWFDGSAMPNPGAISLGAVLCSPLGIVTTISRASGHGDSNDAEYLALIAVLEEAVSQHATTLLIYGDSRIVIEDVTGVHLVAALSPLRRQAQLLLQRFGDTSFCWIPRAKNGRADALARSGR